MSRTAILGWGSLIYHLGNLSDQVTGEWNPGGPPLPVEFSRISATKRHGALTLVIDETCGTLTPTQYIVSSRIDPDEAVEDLREREGTALRRVGLVDLRSGFVRSRSESIGNLIADWAERRGFDAVVWTDLPSNFAEERHQPFTIANAIVHLQSLTPTGIAEARDYINNAPADVDTELRRVLRENDWWNSIQ